jgi:hypothetical protein
VSAMSRESCSVCFLLLSGSSTVPPPAFLKERHGCSSEWHYSECNSLVKSAGGSETALGFRLTGFLMLDIFGKKRWQPGSGVPLTCSS